MNNCWSCKYQKIGGATLLGVCSWFAANGRDNKDIPPHIVDIGCKKFESKTLKETDVQDNITE